MCCRMANREHRRAETAASAAGGPVGLCHLCESSQDSSNCKFSSVPIFYGNPSSRQYSAWVLPLLQRRRGSDMLPGATRHGAVSPRADADLAEIRQVRGGTGTTLPYQRRRSLTGSPRLAVRGQLQGYSPLAQQTTRCPSPNLHRHQISRRSRPPPFRISPGTACMRIRHGSLFSPELGTH